MSNINNNDPYYDDIASGKVPGKVPGKSIMSAMGEREAMGILSSGEDVWRGNELSPLPTSHVSIPLPDSGGEQMTIVSEDAADNSVGTGVRTLRIHYIDAAGAEQTEDIITNGLTGVNTVATNIRFVNDMYSLTVGSNGVSEGNIIIHKTGTVGLVYNMLFIGGNKSLVPHRMVPVGKNLIIKGWHLSEAQDKRLVFRIRSTDMNGELIPGVFCFKDTNYIRKTSSGQLDCNVYVPSLSIVKISAWGDQTGAEGSCAWWGVLSNN